jgi:putative NADH-flavin reductase
MPPIGRRDRTATARGLENWWRPWALRSAQSAPRGRTGKFRLGTDQLLVDADRESKISFEDYAIALVDKLETPRPSRQRITIEY